MTYFDQPNLPDSRREGFVLERDASRTPTPPPRTQTPVTTTSPALSLGKRRSSADLGAQPDCTLKIDLYNMKQIKATSELGHWHSGSARAVITFRREDGKTERTAISSTHSMQVALGHLTRSMDGPDAVVPPQTKSLYRYASAIKGFLTVMGDQVHQHLSGKTSAQRDAIPYTC